MREHLTVEIAHDRDGWVRIDWENTMAGPADRRASERMAVNRGTSCAYVGRVIDDIGAVKIRDVSLEGIGIVIMKSVPVGSMLVIGLSNPDKNFVKTIILEVAHVTPITGAFLVGGTFLEPLTYQELTTLVM